MSMRRLQYFIAVAEELHFGRAAERLHMAQPPLSQQIRKLEEALGVALFIRTNRRVELTEAGKAYLGDVREILSRLEHAGERAKLVAEGLEGELELGFVAPSMDGPLPMIIQQFRSAHPGIYLQLREAGTPKLLEMMAAQHLDVACIRYFDQDLYGAEAVIYQREPYVLAVPTGDPLAEKTSIELSDLEEKPLILFPRRTNPVLHDCFLSAFQSMHVTPVLRQEAQSKHTMAALVAAQMGVGFVPSSMTRSPREGVIYLQLGEITSKLLPQVELAAVYRPESSSVVQSFVQAIWDFVGSAGREEGE
ncbi:MAG: LysR family transcriptional regulator [Desulfovibrio sp.]|uniref:LysR family transcriptional regulator n=1 Tax=Desulfovibrio sp. 7SRBS1 TaxID=3378064 RepID=UPI003B3D32A0